MTQLKDVILIAWICSFFAPLLAGPIDKDTPHEPVQKTTYKIPELPIRVPDDVKDPKNPFGDPLKPIEGTVEHPEEVPRDTMCISEASLDCQRRCITLEENCICGTNKKTYRNVCEMACMRKVDQETINIESMGKCEPLCSIERIEDYKSIVKDLMTTRYLVDHVKRCNKISNCNQAKVVLQYATKSGSQSIMECPQHLPAFFLFTGLDCSEYVDTTLQSVFNNETVVNCKSVSKVRQRLFNKKNCGWNTQGPSDKELVTWSFDTLDANVDGILVESELNILTNIPDQQCGEAFFMSCDKDMDGNLREDEWSSCLGCPDCHRPCLVYQSKRLASTLQRRYVQPITTCKKDGTCASKQCEKLWDLHQVCWCVDPQCREIEGTRSYAEMDCNAQR